MPEGFLVEARCGRCESALTAWTILAGVLRTKGFSRTLQLGLAAGVLVAVFAGDVADWWQSEPFSLKAQMLNAEADATLAGPSLANDPLHGEAQ